MREPVLQDKRQEHVKFCKYASALIETVSGKTQNSTIDASLEKIRKVKNRVLAVHTPYQCIFSVVSHLINNLVGRCCCSNKNYLPRKGIVTTYSLTSVCKRLNKDCQYVTTGGRTTKMYHTTTNQHSIMSTPVLACYAKICKNRSNMLMWF